MAASTTPDAAGPFVCPECGKTFGRPQGLGAHRRSAHGVKGGSATAARRRSSLTGRSGRRARSGRASAPAAAPVRSATASPAAAATPAVDAGGAGTRRRTARRGAAGRGAGDAVNHDALLGLLYPNGIPAREQVIHAVASWLEEADRLARLR